jgi:hypothetical protein
VEIPASERLAAHASEAAVGVPSEVLDEGPEPIAQRTLDPGGGRDEDGTADRPV